MAGMARNVLPFKLQATPELLTANAGLAVFGEFVRAVGIPRAVEQCLPAPGSAGGYAALAYVMPLTLMLCGGGRSLEDLRQIYTDDGLRRLLKLDHTPSTDAVGDWLRRMGQAKGQGMGAGLSGLGQVNRRIVAQRLRQMERAGDAGSAGSAGSTCNSRSTSHTLDIDASQIVAEKEAAKWTYKGERGYMPIIGHLAEAGVVVHEEFRDGNAAPASGNLPFIKDCQEAMPSGHRVKRLRADSATYQAEVFNYCEAQGIEFAIGGRWGASVTALVQGIGEAQWKKYADCAIAEVTHSMNETGKAFRLVVVRRQHQADLFDEQGQPQEAKLLIKYTLIASNFAANYSADDIYIWYCQRGQASENGIKELKIGFGMERMPCGQLGANAVFFRIGAITHNLFVLFKAVTLDPSWQRHQVQTVRWRLLHLAGKVIHSARGQILKVSAAALDILETIRRRTREFAVLARAAPA